MEEKVLDVIADINKTRSQTAASTKDEVRVMRAMLNDSTYKVDVYNKNGKDSEYSPYDDARTMVTSILKSTTNMSNAEATDLANRYEFGNKEAQSMISISKEFVNTYLESGRRMSFGGRKTSNISILKKEKAERISSFPIKVGINPDGTDKYESAKGDLIPAHGTLKVFSPAPAWLKK